MEVLCPNPDCRKLHQVADALAGAQYWCGKCGTKFILPPPATGPASVAAAPGPVGEDVDLGDGTDDAKSGKKAVQIGRFRVLARIGKGSYGTVFRAYDPQLEREVALKMPRSAALAHPRVKGAFLGEARAAAQLHHPHIVPIYDAGFDGRYYYIASAFIEGRTLAKAVDAKQVDFREGARVIMAMAQALAYAHSLGIVHRDVKPANVMLDLRGEPHLMDFGIAYRQASQDNLTVESGVLGSPAYMSPEQAEGKNREITAASDQYSLGVMLYEILCGQRPFTGTTQSILDQKVQALPPAPRSVQAAVPPDLDAIVMKALARQPGDRYPSCLELAEDLRRWLDGVPVSARPLSVSEKLARWCRRQPALAVATALVAILLIAVAVISTVSAVKLAAAAREQAALREDAEKNETMARDEAERAESEAQKALAAQKEAEDALSEKQRLELHARRTEREKQAADNEAEKALREKEKAEAAAEEAELEANLTQAKALAEVFRYDDAIRLLDRIRESSGSELAKTAQTLREEYRKQKETLAALTARDVDLLSAFVDGSRLSRDSQTMLLRSYHLMADQLAPLLKERNLDGARHVLELYAEKPAHGALKTFLRAYHAELGMLRVFLESAAAAAKRREGQSVDFRGLPARLARVHPDRITLEISGKSQDRKWTELRGYDFLRLLDLSEDAATPDDLLAAGLLYWCDGDRKEATRYFTKVAPTHRNTFYRELVLVTSEADACHTLDGLRQAMAAEDLKMLQTLSKKFAEDSGQTRMARIYDAFLQNCQETILRLQGEQKEVSRKIADDLLSEIANEYSRKKEELKYSFNREIDAIDDEISKLRHMSEIDALREGAGISKADLKKQQQNALNKATSARGLYARRLRSLERDCKREQDSVQSRLLTLKKQVADGKEFTPDQIRAFLKEGKAE